LNNLIYVLIIYFIIKKGWQTIFFFLYFASEQWCVRCIRLEAAWSGGIWSTKFIF